MQQTTEQKPVEPLREFSRRTLLNISIIAGLFAVIVGGMFFVNYLQMKVLDPLQTERLEMLKLKLHEEPDNQDLVEDIRQLDLELRRSRLNRLVYIRRSSILLLAGIAICLAAWKLAGSLKPPHPRPEHQQDLQEMQVQQAIYGRWGITLGFAVLCLFALFITGRKDIRFEENLPAYPSSSEWLANWPLFRGPQGAGVSAYENVPTHWDESTQQGILWKSKVPLDGYNSPVVWDNRVFLSGADKTQQKVFCFDLANGKLLWVADVPRGNLAEIEVRQDTGYAAPTMAVDGRRAYVIFASGDVAAFDFEGHRLWIKRLRTPDSVYGYASSLCMYRNLLLIQFDQGSADDGKSRMIAVDGFSGGTVWETVRPVGSSWTSPIVSIAEEKPQLITSGNPFAVAYEPALGRELWRAECLGEDLAASPIYVNGLAIVASPYEHIVAIKTDGLGNITQTHIAWTTRDGLPDICSPVSNGELLFTLTTAGILTCFELDSGKKIWDKDLETSFHASPGIVGDKLYLMSDKGETVIAETARQYKEIRRCKLEQGSFASPAFVDGRILVRTKDHLYCLGTNN